MGTNRIKGRVSKTLPDAVKSPAKSRSPEWEQAVCSAAARLNEGWVLPETKCNPAVAEELAALLCAYGA